MNGLIKEFIEINRLIISVASGETFSDTCTVATQNSIPGTIVLFSAETIRMKVVVAYLFASDEDDMAG
jgi:hypothetical protein